MKFITIILVFLFSFSLQNTAFAIIHKSTDNVSSPVLTKVKKPNFMQKLALARFAQKLDTAKVYQKAAVETQGDKLAHIGFSSSLGGIVSFGLLFLLGVIGTGFGEGFIFAMLYFMGVLALLVGLIISIIALTSNDITPKGKVKAGWGIGFIGIAFLLFYLVIAVLFGG